MTLGLPIPLSYQSSNVTDKVPTLDELIVDCQAPVFEPGLEVKDGVRVYEYQGEQFTPKVWNAQNEIDGVYIMDEIILKDCKLYKVTGKSGTGITYHQKPKEVNEYNCYDYDMDYLDWNCRYVKVSSATACNWLTKKWNAHNKQYTMCWDNCNDLHKWAVRDTRAACYVKYNTIKTSSKYDSSADIKATIVSWGAPGLSRSNTVQMNSMIERGDYYYLRTNKDIPLEYHTWTTGTAFDYSYGAVISPADIDGFVQKRLHAAHLPFDGKNYSRTIWDTKETEGFARWDIIASEDIDSIALGAVVCDTVDFRISDQDGNSLFELNTYPIDNTIAPGRNEVYPSTIVLYTDKTYPAGSVVTIMLYASEVTIGEIVGASKLDAGFTNLNFKNTFKDFSPREQDQWGNWDYINGVKVKVHTGTVEYPISSYDQINRLMLLIGGQKVVINSSDSTLNEVPDGRRVFEATMMIARFVKFDLQSTEVDKRIGAKATYAFSIEELV